MKIAISSHNGKFDSPFSARFGRCEYFIFIDTDTNDWTSIENPAASASSGAGSHVVQFLISNGIEATITGRYGPTAFTALDVAGIQAFEAEEGTPEELLKRFLAGDLIKVNEATGPKLH